MDVVQRFEEALGDLESSGASRLIVDLRGLSFLDSTALGVVLALRRRTGEAGIALSIVRPPPGVAQVFSLTRAGEHLPLVDTA